MSDEDLRQLERAAAADRDAWLRLAEALERLGRHDDAFEALRAGIEQLHCFEEPLD